MVKKTTNEELARMIKVGFDDVTGRMATKADLQNVKADLENKKETAKLELENKINRLENGKSEIKGALIPKLDFEDLSARVKYTETKLGIVSGK